MPLTAAIARKPTKSNVFIKQVSPSFSTMYPTEKLNPL